MDVSNDFKFKNFEKTFFRFGKSYEVYLTESGKNPNLFLPFFLVKNRTKKSVKRIPQRNKFMRKSFTHLSGWKINQRVDVENPSQPRKHVKTVPYIDVNFAASQMLEEGF